MAQSQVLKYRFQFKFEDAQLGKPGMYIAQHTYTIILRLILTFRENAINL